MITIMKGLPEDVLGVKARGAITQADYTDTLIPAAEEKLAHHEKLKALYFLGDLQSFEPGAMWEDAGFFFGNWNRFSRMALVTDHVWAQGMTLFFKPFMPCEVKIFGADNLEEAKRWIAADNAAGNDKNKKGGHEKPAVH